MLPGNIMIFSGDVFCLSLLFELCAKTDSGPQAVNLSVEFFALFCSLIKRWL